MQFRHAKSMLGGLSGAHINVKTPEISAALESAEFQTAVGVITHVLLAPPPEVGNVSGTGLALSLCRL